MLTTRTVSLSTSRPALFVRPNVANLSTRFAPVANRVPSVQVKAASDEPPADEPVDASPSDLVAEKLKKEAGFMKNLSYIAFWAQLGLSVVSGGVLIFSIALAPMTDMSKWLSVIGCVFGFISSFFAHGFLKLSRKLISGETVEPSFLISNLLHNARLNLWGLAATVFGLQASVGMLVAKTLMNSAQSGVVYAQQPSNALVSVDVFALQASTNTLLCHIVGLVFANWMLSTVNKSMPKTA